MKTKILMTYEAMAGEMEGFELNSILFETKGGKKYYSTWSFQSLLFNQEHKGICFIGVLDYFYNFKCNSKGESTYEKYAVSSEEAEDFLKDTRIDIVEIFYYGCEIKGLKIDKILIEDEDFKKIYTLKAKNSETTKRFTFE